MNKRVTTIDNDYKKEALKKKPNESFRTAIADVIVSNPETNERMNYTSKFLIDTGSNISILNIAFNHFIETTKPTQIDEVTIQYGSGRPKPLPVYEFRFSIKGDVYDVIAAHDKDLMLLSLIGMYGFINELDSLIVSKDTTKLVSAWR